MHLGEQDTRISMYCSSGARIGCGAGTVDVLLLVLVASLLVVLDGSALLRPMWLALVL